MYQRCPKATLIGKAVLPGYRLDFTIYSEKRDCGCADIVPEIGSEVWGLLYSITDEDLQSLDDAEGVTKEKYRRVQVVINKEKGGQITAEVYEVVHKSAKELRPSKHYLSQLTGPAKEFLFPEEYQQMLGKISTSD